MLKCSRCHHVFPGPWAATTRKRAEPKPPAPPPVAGETPTFAFDEDDDWRDDTIAPPPRAEQFDLDIEDAPPATVEPPVAAAPEVEPAVEVELEPEVEPAREIRAAAAPDAPISLTWDDPNDSEDGMSEPRRISLRPVLILLVLIVLMYAVIARTLYSNPEWAQNLVRGVPLLGDGFDGELLNDQVDLIKVDGGYQHTKEGKTFFLVTGQALNNAPVPLVQVHVMVKLLDKDGNVLQEKPTLCGSSVPLSVLRDLSLHAMEIIPHLKPTGRSVIQPGETSPFVIVFTDVPAGVSEFSTEVVAAQRQV